MQKNWYTIRKLAFRRFIEQKQMPGPIPAFILPEVFWSWFLCGLWSERQICVHFLLTHQARVYVYDECIIFEKQSVFFWPKTGRYSTFWDFRWDMQLSPEGNYDGVKYILLHSKYYRLSTRKFYWMLKCTWPFFGIMTHTH